MPRKKKKDEATIGVRIKHDDKGNINGLQIKGTPGLLPDGMPGRIIRVDPDTGEALYVDAEKYAEARKYSAAPTTSVPAPILILKKVLAAEGRIDNKLKALNRLFSNLKGTLSRTVEAEEFAFRRCETELELLKLKKRQLQDHMDEIDKQIELKGGELCERRTYVDHYGQALKDLQANKDENNSK